MRATVLLSGLLALLLITAGCSQGPAVTPGPTATTPLGPASEGVAATVNGQPISLATYEAQLEIAMASYGQQGNLDPQSADGQAALAGLRQQVLEWLIDQALVDQAAEREGVAVDDARVTAEVERVRNENPGGFAAWLEANGFTEETFRAQTRSDLLGAAMRDRVTADIGDKMEQAHLRHILVETEAEARSLQEQIAQGQATLEELARARSIDEASRERGGDLGFTPRGLLPESIEKVAFGLQPGQVAGPIESPFGWHLVQLVELDPAREVAPEMQATLRQEVFMRWLEGERAKARIERYVE